MSEHQAAKRKCPYCGKVTDSQGLYAHVMSSDDDIHNDAGSVPEGFNPREAPVVTEDEEVIEADLDEDYPNRLMLCHHCGTMCKGRRGLAIHLSKSAGDELHPPDVSIADGNYTEIPADSDWNPLVDQSELSQLHDEITSDIVEYELYSTGSDDDASATYVSDQELQQLIDQAVIPQAANKTEQVASLLNQVPELYDRAEAVKEVIGCSTTTYYEGRKLYDNNAAPEMETVSSNERVDRVEEIVWEGDSETVVVGGEQYVPISAVKGIVRRVNSASNKIDMAAEELDEVSSEGARIVMQSQ